MMKRAKRGTYKPKNKVTVILPDGRFVATHIIEQNAQTVWTTFGTFRKFIEKPLPKKPAVITWQWIVQSNVKLELN